MVHKAGQQFAHYAAASYGIPPLSRIYFTYFVVFKGELHSNSWNLTFVNKLKFCDLLFLKHQKIDNRSWDIYVFSHTETCFYTFSQ